MRILTVALPWLGGSGTVAFRIAAHLAQQPGIYSRFLSYERPFHDSGDIAVSTVTVRQYPSFRYPLIEMSFVEDILRCCTEHRIDIIHAHYGISCGHAGLFARQILAGTNPVSLVVTFHGTDVIGPDGSNPGADVFSELNRALLRDADAVSFVSRSLREEAERIYGTVRDGVCVIPNGVDTSVFTPGTDAGRRMIHVSNFKPIKQPDMVIAVFVEVLRTHPDTELVCVGGGPALEKTKRLADRLGISQSVSFTGSLPERGVVRQLQRSRVLLLPSLYESFSLAALEAQACGVPVVASRVGGLAEVVADGETGYLINDPHDISAFAARIGDLLSGDGTFGAKARERALRFSHTTVYRQYHDLYARVIGTRKRPPGIRRP